MHSDVLESDKLFDGQFLANFDPTSWEEVLKFFYKFGIKNMLFRPVTNQSTYRM